MVAQHAMQGGGCWLTGRLTDGRADSESTLLPSWRMCLHACSRKGVISSDSAVMPALSTRRSLPWLLYQAGSAHHHRIPRRCMHASLFLAAGTWQLLMLLWGSIQAAICGARCLLQPKARALQWHQSLHCNSNGRALCLGGQALTHEQHVDLVRQETQLTGHRQQHKGKLSNLRHAQAHSQSCPHWVLEHVNNNADLHTHSDNPQFLEGHDIAGFLHIRGGT